MDTRVVPLAASSCSPAIAVAREAIAQHRDTPGPLLPILHAIQHRLRCIPPETVGTLAEALNLSRAEVHGVITFYPHFRTAPPGDHVIEVCRAESCQSRGGEAIAAHAEARLGCSFNATTDDGRYTLESVYCLGLCAQSPSMMIDGKPYARITPARFDRLMANAVAAAGVAPNTPSAAAMAMQRGAPSTATAGNDQSPLATPTVHPTAASGNLEASA